MTPHEQAKLAAHLVLRYPSLPHETTRLWAQDVEASHFDDAERGVQTMARSVKFPTLADLVEHIAAARADRERAEARERPALPDGRTWTPEECRENHVRVGVLCELVVAVQRGERAPMTTDELVAASLVEAKRRLAAGGGG